MGGGKKGEKGFFFSVSCGDGMIKFGGSNSVYAKHEEMILLRNGVTDIYSMLMMMI